MKLGDALILFVMLLPSTLPAQDSQYLESLQRGVRSERLSNGMRVLVHRRRQAPVFSAVISVGVGSVNEDCGQTGTSHLLEHMAFKGTPSLGTRDYKREEPLLMQVETLMRRRDAEKGLSAAEEAELARLHRELASLWNIEGLDWEYQKRGAVELDATTGVELTSYFVSLPADQFEFYCWIESERLLHPVMRQFYQERDVVLEERRTTLDDSPDGRLYQALLQAAFVRHPYRHPIIGYADDLARLSASATLDFQRRHYVPSNMVLAIVGDLDPHRVFAVAERYFGRIPQGSMTGETVVSETPQENERRVVLPAPSEPLLMIGYHKPVYPHPDEPALIVLAELLAGGPASLLETELVKRGKAAASISYYDAPGDKYPNLAVFQIEPRAPHTNQALLEAFDRLLTKFARDPLRADRIDGVKRSLLAADIRALRSNLTLAEELAAAELLYGDWHELIEGQRRVQAVLPDDIIRVFSTYFRPKNRTVAMLEAQP